LRVRGPVLLGEGCPVDEVAPKTGQGLAVPRLDVGGTRFRVLTRHAADTHDRLFEPVQHDETHLQQDLELCDDVFGRALVEGLGAVATLQNEGLPLLRPGDQGLQRIDFPGVDDRR
jgi:hypothetical protein